MKHMTTTKLAWSLGALLLGSQAITTAQADPIASAESVVTFENFTISWTGGAQVDSGDFSSLSVSSSMLTAANMTGTTGVSDNPSSATGSPLVAESTRGTVDAVITGIPGATTTTVFNVVTLPLTGNFSASASNEVGAPITNFPNSTTPVAANADLHNGSYASLDTLAGSAGTSTSSQLASTYEFVSLVSGTLDFNFDVGAYIAAYLSAGAAQTASASWSVSFTIVDTTTGGTGLPTVFTIGDNISNNAPGSGTMLTGIGNAAAPGGVITTSAAGFTTASIVAGDTYQLTATISTRAQVERVAEVPEPETLGLLAIGLLGLALSRKTKKLSGRIYS